MPQSFQQPQVYLVVVKLKSIDRIVRIDTAFESFNDAARRVQSIHLDPRERAEVIAKALYVAEEVR